MKDISKTGINLLFSGILINEFKFPCTFLKTVVSNILFERSLGKFRYFYATIRVPLNSVESWDVFSCWIFG